MEAMIGTDLSKRWGQLEDKLSVIGSVFWNYDGRMRQGSKDIKRSDSLHWLDGGSRLIRVCNGCWICLDKDQIGRGWNIKRVQLDNSGLK